MMRENTEKLENKHLSKLRQLITEQKIQALIVPTADPHQSEYIPAYWQIRSWISGFSGSAGTAVITLSHAGLWTDARYFIQAEKELYPDFTLHKQTSSPETYYVNWLANNLQTGDCVGYDALLFSTEAIENLSKVLKKKGIKIKNVGDLFCGLWNDRPPMPKQMIFEHSEKYAGKSSDEKIKILLKKIENKSLLITKLDDIAWLLNVRGNDIAYNPVFLAYFFINNSEKIIFIDPTKIPKSIENKWKNQNIQIQPYNKIVSFLNNYTENKHILLEKSTINHNIYQALHPTCKITEAKYIVAEMKSIKNQTEIANYEQTQIKDNVALCYFFKWLEENYKKEKVTELSAAQKLEYFRTQQPNFKGVSFASISAFAENSALPHYAPTKQSNTLIDDSNLYLIDSGAQYLDGTTDITRTITLGNPTTEQIRNFTLVLKGHICLATAVFPKGTKGYQLDILARQYLWQDAKNFGHGTGHGVGFFLNVHEGPQGIAPDLRETSKFPIQAGMLITNEPGFYDEGNYGIRIENTLLCVPFRSSKFGDFLAFQTISHFPIDVKLIDKKLLSENEKKWLNTYHQKTYELLSPHLDKDLNEWLKLKTKKI